MYHLTRWKCIRKGEVNLDKTENRVIFRSAERTFTTAERTFATAERTFTTAERKPFALL